MAERDFLRGVNDQLDKSIRVVSEALEAGTPDPSLLSESRRQAEDAMARLRDLAPRGPAQDEVRSTMQHLDILISLIDSVESAPELSRKLAAHLLEEQTSHQVPMAPAETGSLPGGRRPLTVGSLIGR